MPRWSRKPEKHEDEEAVARHEEFKITVEAKIALRQNNPNPERPDTGFLRTQTFAFQDEINQLLSLIFLRSSLAILMIMERRHHVFSVDLLERYATKGRGAITCMATGNDVIVLATSKGWAIRHDFGVCDSYDIDLSVGRTGEQSIHKVFVDHGGSHCIATVIGSSGADTYYTHAKWTKPRILSKLKGLVVNAVAWNRQHIIEASTREIILGTDNGQLYEMAVDVKDKMEKYIKLLFELKELPEAFTGLQMETANVHNGTRFYVMAVTPTRLYSFTGIGSLDAVFASYVDRTVHFMELPGEIPNRLIQSLLWLKQTR